MSWVLLSATDPQGQGAYTVYRNKKTGKAKIKVKVTVASNDVRYQVGSGTPSVVSMEQKSGAGTVQPHFWESGEFTYSWKQVGNDYLMRVTDANGTYDITAEEEPD